MSKIWLALEDTKIAGLEYHMEWEGHDNLEMAKKEFDYVKSAIMGSGGKHPNTYIYEADVPLYGIKPSPFDIDAFANYFGNK